MSAPSACYIWSVYSTEMFTRDGIKANWAAYIFAQATAKHHRVETVSLFWLSYLDLKLIWLLFPDKNPKGKLTDWMLEKETFTFPPVFLRWKYHSNKTQPRVPVMAFCRLIWVAEGKALEIALTWNVSKLEVFFPPFWSPLSISLWLNKC